MFHAISARLGRLTRRTRSRLATPFDYATWYGWQVQRIRPGTWQFRDPRFGQTSTKPAPPRSWAYAAIARRIRDLGIPGQHTNAERGA
jgi:hypothetical protein